MTAQRPEKIIVDGTEKPLYCEPSIPSDSPFIIDLEQILCDPSIMFDPDYEKRFNITPEMHERLHSMESSACWRGYVGTWEIKGNTLYLIEIEGKYQLTNNNPVLANWINGELIIPEGECLGMFDTGYGWEFSAHKCIHIQNGKVIKTEIRQNL